MTVELVMAALALAMAAILLASKILDFAKKKNGNSISVKSSPQALTNTELRALHDWTRDLHNWHSREDEDGRKVWYNDRALGEAMKKISEAFTIQTEILRRLGPKIEDAIDKRNRS